jgi:hypothetical protein
MAIDKTIIETYKPKVDIVRKNFDNSNDLIDRLSNLASFYDGIFESTFKNYTINLDNQKYNLQDLITSEDFKVFFLSIIEKKYSELVDKLKKIIDKNGNNIVK